MKLRHIPEPLLEFGENNHICPRTGITKYDVYDTRLKVRRDRIIVGAVGTSSSLVKFDEWIERCRGLISPQDSRLPNLYVEFCGFNSEVIQTFG